MLGRCSEVAINEYPSPSGPRPSMAKKSPFRRKTSRSSGAQRKQFGWELKGADTGANYQRYPTCRRS